MCFRNDYFQIGIFDESVENFSYLKKTWFFLLQLIANRKWKNGIFLFENTEENEKTCVNLFIENDSFMTLFFQLVKKHFKKNKSN
jgi:hypothetical protein